MEGVGGEQDAAASQCLGAPELSLPAHSTWKGLSRDGILDWVDLWRIVFLRMSYHGRAVCFLAQGLQPRHGPEPGVKSMKM